MAIRDAERSAGEEAERRHADIEARHLELQDAHAGVETEHRDLLDEHAAVQEQHRELQRRHRTLDTANARLRSDLQKLQDAHGKEQSTRKDAHHRGRRVTLELDQVRGDMQRLQQICDDHATTKDGEQQRHMQLEQQLAQLRTDLEQLQVDRDAEASSASEVRRQHVEMTADVERLRADGKQLRDARDAERASREEANRLQESMVEETDRLRMQASFLDSELQKFTIRVVASEERSKALTAERDAERENSRRRSVALQEQQASELEATRTREIVERHEVTIHEYKVRSGRSQAEIAELQRELQEIEVAKETLASDSKRLQNMEGRHDDAIAKLRSSISSEEQVIRQLQGDIEAQKSHTPKSSYGGPNESRVSMLSEEGSFDNSRRSGAKMTVNLLDDSPGPRPGGGGMVTVDLGGESELPVASRSQRPSLRGQPPQEKVMVSLDDFSPTLSPVRPGTHQQDDDDHSSSVL